MFAIPAFILMLWQDLKMSSTCYDIGGVFVDHVVEMPNLWMNLWIRSFRMLWHGLGRTKIDSKG